MQSVAITISSWGIKIWIVRGLTMDLFGWLKDWQAGLRGQWVSGLSAPCLRCDADLLSWSLLCLASAQRWVNDFLLWKVSGVCLKALEMLHVTHSLLSAIANVLTGHVSLPLSLPVGWLTTCWLVYFPLVLHWKGTTLYQCVCWMQVHWGCISDTVSGTLHSRLR